MMGTLKGKIFAALILLALHAQAASAARRVGDFEAVGLDGVAYTQEILKDAKLTMFNAWGTFCPPCLREMPDLGALAGELKSSGVQIVGLVCDWFDRAGNASAAQLDKARSLVEKTGADYLHLLLGGDLARSLGEFYAIPQTFFVNSSGEVIGEVTGAQSAERWRAAIREMLKRCE